jgi:hypothetical protein
MDLRGRIDEKIPPAREINQPTGIVRREKAAF